MGNLAGKRRDFVVTHPLHKISPDFFAFPPHRALSHKENCIPEGAFPSFCPPLLSPELRLLGPDDLSPGVKDVER